MQKNTNYIEIEDAKLIHGDSVVEIKSIPDESIGLTVFSPPFPELYCYSDDDRDMGNCRDSPQATL